jgi:L-aminopeptidase/D-esterase-like protein
MAGSITDVPGIKVGYAQDRQARTGCTVILAPPGTMGGIAVCGTAPATRELDLLRIDGITREIHAVLLTGGSAFGLDAAGGVLAWLEQKGIGFDAGVARVPLVPTLSLFDLAYGRADVRPDAAMGRRACESATDGTIETGAVGVGTGATVGKLFGMEHFSPSGVGTASARIGDVVVGALAVSNAFGDLVDGKGKIVAGARDPKNPKRFVDTAAYLREHGMQKGDAFANCTFAVVATDARLDRREANIVAGMAMAAFGRTIRPAHTPYDFDAVIVLACGESKPDLTTLGSAAADLVAEAFISGAAS